MKPPKQIRPVVKAVSLATHGEESLKATFRRLAEVSRLKAMAPTVAPPAKVGKGALSTAERDCFSLAAEVASRTNNKAQGEAYAKAVAAATQRADARFFEIVAAAMRAVHAARDGAMSAATMHEILSLTAKLELEQESGTLPTTLEVSKRAYDIGCLWFEDDSDRLAAPQEKAAWSKARKATGLDYLPRSTRGKGAD